MRSMRTNVQPNLILQTCTLKHGSNCFAAGRPTGFQFRLALLCPKMSILKPTKQPVLSVLQGHNGVTLLPSLLLLVLH